MKRNILALTVLTATLTWSSVASANEQTDRLEIRSQEQTIIDATAKDAYSNVNEHPTDAVLMNSGAMLVSKLIKTDPSGDTLRQQNNQVLNTQLTKQNKTDSQVKSRLVGTWRASIFEYGIKTEILWTIQPNGISYFSFQYPNGNILTKTTTWDYSGNIITQVSTDGEIAKGSIEFINSNYFVLTILTNSDPGSAGFKRHYYRDSP